MRELRAPYTVFIIDLAFALELALLEAPNALRPFVAPVDGTARSIGNQSIAVTGLALVRAY